MLISGCSHSATKPHTEDKTIILRACSQVHRSLSDSKDNRDIGVTLEDPEHSEVTPCCTSRHLLCGEAHRRRVALLRYWLWFVVLGH